MDGPPPIGRVGTHPGTAQAVVIAIEPIRRPDPFGLGDRDLAIHRLEPIFAWPYKTGLGDKSVPDLPAHDIQELEPHFGIQEQHLKQEPAVRAHQGCASGVFICCDRDLCRPVGHSHCTGFRYIRRPTGIAPTGSTPTSTKREANRDCKRSRHPLNCTRIVRARL